ncbi:hypothetical protein C0J52_10284 [Blattella germanica]|nr:hypothetical protein C0J52_10284 [Blattella germanica]
MDKDGQTFEKEFEIWLRRLSNGQLGSNSDILIKITKGRKSTWQHLMNTLRPAHEVEHIRKVLTLKRLATKMKLKQQLEEKKKQIVIMEHDYEQSSQNLRILNCEMQSIEKRTEELGIKTALIDCKKQDLQKKATMYEQIREVTYLVKQPANFYHDTQMETLCYRAICESHVHLKELYDRYKADHIDIEELLDKKGAMIDFVKHRMKELPVVSIWQTMLNIMGLNRKYECLQKDIARLPEMLDKSVVANLNIAMKELETAFSKEIKLFLELPLNVFDKAVLPSCQQTLKYNLHLAEMSDSPNLPDLLTVLSGAPSASPLRIVLEGYENKMYLSALKGEETNNTLSTSSDDMDVTSLLKAENSSMARITDIMETLKMSLEECTNIAEKAEVNFKTWIEPPLQHAVPSDWRVQEKSFKEWQDCYDDLLRRLP